ncbi:hypothetical protein NDU88_000652 [Pleurodeles waltl]|uniref:Uncharacterized protein n=1 Tax=Pleurodeles waltl TaxID=8319 RepID=A0AAV7TGC4_PLEWA|nr:hypothetical protein NDU88_000652 [Pleurodeles waltl]
MEMYMGEESCFRDDTFMQLVPVVVKIFSSGAIKGDMLIGIAIAPFLHLTLPGTEYFKEIIFASTNDKSNLELLKWLQNEPDAFNWSGAAKVMCELEGKGNTWMEKQMALRQKIKQVLSCDVTKAYISSMFRPSKQILC